MMLCNGYDTVIRLHLIEVVIIKEIKGLFIGKYVAYYKPPRHVQTDMQDGISAYWLR